VVLPHLVRAVALHRPLKVLDLGAGTGYLTRHLVAHTPPSKVAWTLLDSNPDLLAIALASMPSDLRISSFEFDLSTPANDRPAIEADFAFAAFTFLEFEITEAVARNCASLLRPEGTLLIYLPDTFADIRAAGARAIDSYIDGSCVITKTDHFTGASDPFHATRSEVLISTFLQAGLQLASLDLLPRTDRPEKIHCLTFTKTSTV
jgi:trans-aconitate methyltransferase